MTDNNRNPSDNNLDDEAQSRADSSEHLERERSRSEDTPKEEPAEKLNRLLKGETETRDATDPDLVRVEHRHPTGAPAKTGGWMAEGLDPSPAKDERDDSGIDEHDDVPAAHPAGAPTNDADSMLPRVPENDLDATRVAPAAYQPPPSEETTSPPNRFAQLGCGGCLLRMAILGMFMSAALLIGILSFGLYQYAALASSLPSVEDLQARAAQFETTRILDREGNLLYEILDPQAGRRTYVPLDEISPYMVAAILSTEDSQFYSHPGFDLAAMFRALWQNYTQGEIVSGASTITQQVARNLLLSPEEVSRRTARRKTREIMLAAEITRRYSKDEILELYLNQHNFGNLAYGVEAAAETYFGTTAEKLTLAQASFLAGIVQAPSVYNIFTNPDVTLGRHRQVLTLMVKTSQEQGCIYVSNSQQPICVTPEDAGAAAAEITNYPFQPPDIQMRFPHWVTYIRGELEALYDPQTIYRSGFTVYTTLDPNLQMRAQQIVREKVNELADKNATNGALIALDPITGEILAMVGSADFNNEQIDGQINMSIQPRQPGSSIKPLTYTAAFEKGWTPGTLIWDVPSEFPPSGNPDDPRPPYEPVNYDGRFHGPVTIRSALANSYNIPAVKTLDFVGIYDDPQTPEEEGFLAFARRVGITTLNRNDYGLSLTLGGGDVTLLDLTKVFATYANGGVQLPPNGILRIEDTDGAVVYQYETPAGEQLIRPEHAYLITDILSDNAARTPAFGPNSALRLPFPAAAKTGTTNDFRDNWTLGYTPDLAVGVWVGNADYTPMRDTSGLSGAAPIWNEFMLFANERLSGERNIAFVRPVGIVDRVICAVSGAQPSEWCPEQKTEIFASDQPPRPAEEDLWKEAWVDTYSLLLASEQCSEFVDQKLGLNVDDPWARAWLQEESAGQEWAEEMGFEQDPLFFIPNQTCSADSPRPIIAFTDPPNGTTISFSPVSIFGRAAGTSDFKDWVLEYGVGDRPNSWPDIAHSENALRDPGKLVEWDITDLPNGPVTLRLAVRSERGGKAVVELRLNILLPTPTPTATATPTVTLTPTGTATPAATPTPTGTPTPSATWTPSPPP
ncbi:MAG: transglycosylase domain-containing protein [Anaerolineales bacterium]|nr:transglycosylase domain-containing protein [Anaerolineales bacterium]